MAHLGRVEIHGPRRAGNERISFGEEQAHAEIANLENAARVQHQILRLNVAVDDILTVDVAQTREQIKYRDKRPLRLQSAAAAAAVAVAASAMRMAAIIPKNPIKN